MAAQNYKTITAVLSADHEQARRLIAHVIGRPATARTIYPQISDALRRHSKAEEQTLYDALASFPAELAQVQTSYAEHERLEALLAELDATPYSSPRFMQIFYAMNDALEQHLAVEETQVFSFAQAMLPRARQAALAQRYEAKMGRGGTRNVAIMVPSPMARITNPCGCQAGARKANPIPWHRHFMGGLALLRGR